MKRAIIYLTTVYASVPVLLYLFPWILGHVIYCHLLIFPVFVDLGKPEKILNHTCNLYLTTEEGVSVGVWSVHIDQNGLGPSSTEDGGWKEVFQAFVAQHTLPISQWKEAAEKDPEWYREALGDGQPVIIYLHGNLGTRAIYHRLQLVKKLSAAGYHVLSLDYRGFGDSSGEPSEAGLTTDALYLYQWAKQHSRGGLVCLWGHSLGTGVATNTALKLQEHGSLIDAIILEAPFTRIGEVVTNHPLCKLYMFLPGFESLIWNILEMNNIVFANDKNLKTLYSPLLLLHAEDDDIVPYHMGQKLYQISLQAQKERDVKGHVQMVSYSASRKYSHNNIYLDPNLLTVVKEFLHS